MAIDFFKEIIFASDDAVDSRMISYKEKKGTLRKIALKNPQRKERPWQRCSQNTARSGAAAKPTTPSESRKACRRTYIKKFGKRFVDDIGVPKQWIA